MPFDNPEPDDPHVLVGVLFPGNEQATREMAAAFADEFAQLGFSRDQILGLYRRAFYAGAHAALQVLGEQEIGRIVDESLRVWGRCRYVVRDSDPAREPAANLVGPNGFLRVLR